VTSSTGTERRVRSLAVGGEDEDASFELVGFVGVGFVEAAGDEEAALAIHFDAVGSAAVFPVGR
jgi:hypothetical protein